MNNLLKGVDAMGKSKLAQDVNLAMSSDEEISDYSESMAQSGTGALVSQH